MPYVIGGLIALGLLLLLGRLFVTADPRTLVRFIRYVLGVALIVFGGVMILAARWGLGIMLIGGGVSALALGRIGPFDLGGNSRSPGGASTVRSSWLEMRLDHDSGAMDGTVRRGSFAGRKLDDLSEAELTGLRDELAADNESLALFEAYLDRRTPGWREDFQGDAAAGTGRPTDAGAMTDQQAYEILGLAPGVGEAEIRAAHRRLMKKVHPDQGGSTFLAARINEAKDWLLGNHR